MLINVRRSSTVHKIALEIAKKLKSTLYLSLASFAAERKVYIQIDEEIEDTRLIDYRLP